MSSLSSSERFWSKVEKIPDGCWLWKGAKNQKGYGQCTSVVNNVTFRSAHRFAYTEALGKIPDGLTIDHLCRVRHCVNPSHLEPVTMAENLRRSPTFSSNRTHCPSGHPLSGDNVTVHKRGWRICLTCKRAAYKQWRLRRKAKRAALRAARKATTHNPRPRQAIYEDIT